MTPYEHLIEAMLNASVAADMAAYKEMEAIVNRKMRELAEALKSLAPKAA